MIKQIIDLPFEEQLNYFREKLPLPARTLKGVDARYHDFAFSVSKVTSADFIALIKKTLQKNYETGVDFQTFKETLKNSQDGEKILQTFENKHLRTIYDTNIARSYGAGRYKQQRRPGVIKIYPYAQWIHGDSPIPRPHHRELHLKVFPAEHDFWDRAYPPCGFGCRCRVRMISPRMLESMGARVESPPNWRDIVDPGFEFSAGTAKPADFDRVVEDMIDRQPPELHKPIRDKLRKRNAGN